MVYFFRVLLLFMLVSILSACISSSSGRPEFKGKIARSYKDSQEWWPEEKRPKESAPNVLIFILDDVGFAQMGAFGGLIKTPNIDKLASNGLRYNNFHTTSLCSPSRASLLAGRNPHSIGLGSHALTAMGFPGYNAIIPESAKSVANYLKDVGYVNYALGKWDHTPLYEVTQAGPFNRWPSGEGFDHGYNFMSADVHQFVPVMWNDHTPEEYHKSYHLDRDLADRAITWITGHKSVKPGVPFMMLWASGSMHSPHHAPAEYLNKYQGKFDMGWDAAREKILSQQKQLGVVPQSTKLSPRISEIPAWDSLSKEQKKLYARQMEVFAAQMEFVDSQIGRVVSELARIGELENTLIIVTSDNGASAEGGLNGTFNEVIALNGQQTPLEVNMKHYDEWGTESTFPHYHAGWAMAGNTPFKYFKQMVHRGGQHNGLIIHWPRGIRAKGEVRSQYHHIIDLAPTILEAASVAMPERYEGIKQQPMDGISMVYTFDNQQAPTKKNKQYYEMFGNRAIWQDGWKAVSLHANRMPWNVNVSLPFENDQWELYHVAQDFSESDDLAQKFPEKLESLKKVFDEEAWKYGVYPLHDDMAMRLNKQREKMFGNKKDFVYYAPGSVRIAEAAFAPIRNRSHEIATSIDLQGIEEGVIASIGGMTGGFSMFIKNHRLYFDYNYFDMEHYLLESPELPRGPTTLKFNFIKTGNFAGVGELYINEQKVAQVDMPKMHFTAFSISETFDVGQDSGTQVSPLYQGPFKFSGKLDKITVNIKD